MAQPLVSVIVPVWNVEQYLEQCIDSVLGQTLAASEVELILVDDGSTDSSAAIIDRYARDDPRVRAVHQPNSGGPGAPRNAGLDLARGRYVFFLDADDYLGDEALERLTALAERNGSDVVLARMVGVDGRPVPQAAFRRTRDRATISQVYSSLSVLKLFRRSHIECEGLRFPVGLQGGEDAPFTIRAYLAADVISVLADYPAYYARYRVGSQSASGWKWGPELVAHLDRMGERMALVGAALPDGDERTAMMARHAADLVRPFKPQWRRLPEPLRHDAFVAAAGHLQRWVDGRVLRRLPAWNAVRAWCLMHDLESELVDIAELRPQGAAERPVIEGQRVFLGYPHFRDASGIPDWCFEVTDRLDPVLSGLTVTSDARSVRIEGVAYIPLFGGASEVVLRRGEDDRDEIVLPTRVIETPGLRDRRADYPQAGFLVEVQPDALARAHALGSTPRQVLLRLRSRAVVKDVVVPAAGARLQDDGPLRVGPAGLHWQPSRWWQRAARQLRAAR